MPLYDFQCTNTKCEHEFDAITPSTPNIKNKKVFTNEVTPPVTVECPVCGTDSTKVFTTGPKTITAFIPDYPGCKKQRAGYVHSHGDRPSEKIQSGWSPESD